MRTSLLFMVALGAGALPGATRSGVDLAAELRDWDQSCFAGVADYYVSIFAFDDDEVWFEGSGNVNQSPIRETAYTLMFLRGYGAVNGPAHHFPDELRDPVLRWITRKQADDGYFYDTPDQRESINAKQRADLLSCAKTIIEQLGGAPRLPFPEGKQVAPPELASPATYAQWLQELPWDNPYGSGAMVAMYQHFIATFPDRDDYGKVLSAFLLATQNETTGFWGTDPNRWDYRYVSGVMKIDSAVSREWVAGVKPYRRAERMWESTVRAIMDGKGNQSVWVRNAPQVLLATLDELADPPDPEFWQRLMRQVKADTLGLKNEDGGFGRAIPLASNANDTKLMAESARRLYYRLLGHYDSDQFRNFPGLATIYPRIVERFATESGR